MTRVYVHSVGCRLNCSEMETLARRLAGHGHTVAACAAEADVCVLNTCAVTGEAARKSRQMTGRLHRENPRAQLVVTGCYATLYAAEATKLPGTPRIVRNSAKSQLPALLGLETGVANPIWRLHTGRTRAFVKVQDGCDNSCAYCVTTIARGAACSRPLPEVVSEIQALVAAGYQEVILTGVNLGSYGCDRGGADRTMLPDLIKATLAQTDIRRLRLSSLEPWNLEPDLFSLWQDSRLCPQLHLPLQSGSPSVLARMRRKSTPAAFHSLAERTLTLIPDLALTTDMLVGFPGETREEFRESMELVQELPFARLHVFSYSRRPGTTAAQMPGQVPADIKRQRAQAMRELGRQKEETFRRRFIGAEMEVLWEAQRKGGEYQGLTGNYIRVRTTSSEPLHNRITRTKLTELQGSGMRGAAL